MKFNSHNWVRKAWVFVLGIGYVNWGGCICWWYRGSVVCEMGREVDGY